MTNTISSADTVTLGRRRFTCISPGLVRMEFSPTGEFQDRRSIVAYAERETTPFQSVEEKPDGVYLSTSMLTIISREHDKDFFEGNLEVRWNRDGLEHYWRPGDRDHMNLGGTVKSLDIFERYTTIDGVHTADESAPDAKANVHLSQLCSEEDVPYYKRSGADAKLKQMIRIGSLHRGVRLIPEAMPARTVNHTIDQREYGVGVLSRSGYFLLNDSISAVMDEEDFPIERNAPGAKDYYFFCYNDDYTAAMRNFHKLTGRTPMPPKSMLGLIFCRWPAYDEKEAKEIVERFAGEGLPLTTLVVDMEWHKAGWCHWDWDEKMYPNPTEFFKWCHDRGLLVTLNVHPERIVADDSHFAPYVAETGGESRVKTWNENVQDVDSIDLDPCSKAEAKVFEDICLSEKVKEGMDFWWLDGTRGKINGSDSQLILNKQLFENVQHDDRRGALLSRYGGFGSHRYGTFFTGDTQSQWEVLEKLAEFNIRAGHIGISYVSHDTGGFAHPSTPLIDPILFVRWLQFGAFNPVLRLHSSPGSGSRMPWDYGEQNYKNCQKWLSFRNSLMPYIYRNARRQYEEFVPLTRGLFFDHPKDAESYRFDQFYFGDSMIVAPMLTPKYDRDVYLPEGAWFDYRTGESITGGRTFNTFAQLDEIPIYVRAGSLITRQSDAVSPAASHISEVILEVFPGADGRTTLYEDDGRSQGYTRGEFATTRYELVDLGDTLEVRCKGTRGEAFGDTRDHTVEIVLDKAPNRVSYLDGELEAAFDENTRRARVKLPRLTISENWTLTVLM